MLEAVATYCHDYDVCWRPSPTPDGFPFVSPEAAVAWLVLFAACVIALVRTLGRD